MRQTVSKCPKCNGKTKIIDTSDTYDGRRRRRLCKVCSYRFSTIEILASRLRQVEKIKREQRTLARAIEDYLVSVKELLERGRD